MLLMSPKVDKLMFSVLQSAISTCRRLAAAPEMNVFCEPSSKRMFMVALILPLRSAALAVLSRTWLLAGAIATCVVLLAASG